MQVLITISGFCGFCSRIGNAPCTTPFDFLFVISIHVPAWGTTFSAIRWSKSWKFQSTSPRGERRHRGRTDLRGRNFNPRSRVGNDVYSRLIIYLITYFNPRSRVGNDGRKQWLRHSIRIFQSTFPRGERQEIGMLKHHILTFQSTFPRGERLCIHMIQI